jgi:hypothetical protein
MVGEPRPGTTCRAVAQLLDELLERFFFGCLPDEESYWSQKAQKLLAHGLALPNKSKHLKPFQFRSGRE